MTALGPQSLSEGECGLFGWTTETPPRFILFATDSRGVFWTGTQQETFEPSGDFPRLIYPDFRIELGRADQIADAQRYASARLYRTQEDGFERVQPLVILETCQDESIQP